MEDVRGARFLPCEAWEIDIRSGQARAKMAMPDLCLMILNQANHCDQCAYVSTCYHVSRTRIILNKKDARDWEERLW